MDTFKLKGIEPRIPGLLITESMIRNLSDGNSSEISEWFIRRVIEHGGILGVQYYGLPNQDFISIKFEDTKLYCNPGFVLLYFEPGLVPIVGELLTETSYFFTIPKSKIEQCIEP